MKYVYRSILVLAVLFTFACGDKSEPRQETSEDADQESVAVEAPSEPVQAVCLYPGGSGFLLDPEKDKWSPNGLTMGEEVTSYQTFIDHKVRGKVYQYEKIRRSGGEIGYGIDQCVHANYGAGVTKGETRLFSQPKISTIVAKKELPAAQILGISVESYGNFYKIVWVNSNYHVSSDFYIKKSDVSEAEIDIAAARMFSQAQGAKTVDDKREGLNDILQIAPETIFRDMIEEEIEGLTSLDEGSSTDLEAESVETDNTQNGGTQDGDG